MRNKKVRLFSVEEITHFIDCPLKWYLLKKNPDKNKISDTEKLLKVINFYLYRTTDNVECTDNTLLNKLHHQHLGEQKTKRWSKWMQEFKKNFPKNKTDVIAFNYPYTLYLVDNIGVTGVIDVVRYSPYGADIILYNFMDEEFDIDNLINDPTYLIPIMAFERDFSKSLNSIQIYNFPRGEFFDISRPTKIMIKQLDVLKENLYKMRMFNVVPRISIDCGVCPVSKPCSEGLI